MLLILAMEQQRLQERTRSCIRGPMFRDRGVCVDSAKGWRKRRDRSKNITPGIGCQATANEVAVLDKCMQIQNHFGDAMTGQHIYQHHMRWNLQPKASSRQGGGPLVAQCTAIDASTR